MAAGPPGLSSPAGGRIQLRKIDRFGSGSDLGADGRNVAEALVRGAATAGRMRSSPTGVVLHAYRVTDPWCFDARLGTWSSAELAVA
jgi:hypothetical protein